MMSDDFFNPMISSVNKALLRYSAGRAITCAHCGTIADAPRWVTATQGDHSLSACAPCWDKATAGKSMPESVEILDGRIVFKRGKK